MLSKIYVTYAVYKAAIFSVQQTLSINKAIPITHRNQSLVFGVLKSYMTPIPSISHYCHYFSYYRPISITHARSSASNIACIPVKNTISKSQNNMPEPLSTPINNATSWVLKLTIGLIGMFAFLQVYSIQAILPVLMVDLSATEVQAGMIVGATVMAIAIMSPFLGMLSDAVGRKSFIVGALLFLAIPTALIAQSPSIGWMGMWRFMQGLSVPGITVVTIAYIGEEFEGRAVTELMSFYVSGSVLGGFMGRFYLGTCTSLSAGVQAIM